MAGRASSVSRPSSRPPRLTIRERTAVLRARASVPLVLIPIRRRVWTTDYSTDHQPRGITLPALRYLGERP